MNPPRTPTPNACLIAILLITRDSSGDKLTFHYPQKPTVDTPLPPNSTYTASSASSSAASDVASSGDEDDDRQSLTTLHDLTAVERSESGSRIGRRRSRKAVVPEEPAEEEETTKEDGGPPWETVLGFKADFLAGLLAPKARMCKRKFELTVDDVVFLGFPLHVRPDGLWRKKKKRRGRGTEEEELEERMEEAVVADRGSDIDEEEEKEEVGKEEEEAEEAGGVEAATAANGGAADEEKDGDDEGSSTHGGGMSMFHVVFVLNPPEMEYHLRTKQIFNEVVKRFARALKYEQAKDGYVWREAVKINRLRDKAFQNCTHFSELWRQILDQSSLAYAISRIFTDISQNKIAHIFLNDSLGLSLQIPITTETSVLPCITDPQVPGLPLTTADSFGDDDNEGDNLLVRHFTLLFLVDVDSILKDIAAETSDSSNSLTHFVKSCKPSMSFLQISNSSGIPLHNIQVMARHLIHWRKARAIPPIHHRDIYIVSPNADMKRLHTLIPVYAKIFPTLPTLPKILSLLSQKPKQFAAFIPSRDHRSAYCSILAWLLRHGLVTQLRNFAWIRVTRDIKLRVFREQQQQQQQQQQTALLSRSLSLSRSISRSRSPSPEPSRADIVASAAFAYEPHPEDPAFEESIVLAPHQASAVESAWLEMMTRGQPPDVRALWDRLLKYLNGQHAIEKIAVREGISRRDVRRVLGVFDEYIIYARHW